MDIAVPTPDISVQPPPSNEPKGADGATQSTISPPLPPRKTLIVYHLHSKLPPKIVDTNSLPHPPPTNLQLNSLVDSRGNPPYWLFQTLGNFEQAEFFVENNFSDGQINRQLQLLKDHTKPQYHGGSISLLSVHEMHKLLREALEGCEQPEVHHPNSRCLISNSASQFQMEEITVLYRHQGVIENCTYIIRFRPALNAVCQVLEDPDIFESLTLYPEHRYIRKLGTQQNMHVWSEAWTGDDWWHIQVCPWSLYLWPILNVVQDKIGPNYVVIHIILYLDATTLNSLGTKKAWPVHLWIGNISQRVRNSRTSKGKAIHVGYIPLVSIMLQLDRDCVPDISTGTRSFR